MTLIIIIITVGISLLGFNRPEIFHKFQFNPYSALRNKEWYRFFTHAFLHADWVHLLMNMLVLYFFSPVVENYMEYYFGAKGKLFFILLYLGSIPAAVIPTYEKYKNHSWYNSVGASGAVSAIVFSSIIFDPMNRICLYGLLCFPGIVWGIIYLVYSYYMANKETQDHINHEAHFSGAIFGVLFTLAIKPSLGLIFIDQLLGAFR